MPVFSFHNNTQYRFIALSLGALFVCAALVLIGVPTVFGWRMVAHDSQAFLNETQATDDPLLTQVPSLADALRGPIITDTDPALGSVNAPVTATLYTNFGCRRCHEVLRNLQRLQTELPNVIRIIHKDFPSTNKSYATYQAAIAGRCAQEQGKFWEMGELLYQHFDNLTHERFRAHARDIGLNEVTFQRCLDGDTQMSGVSLIDDDITEANALNIIGVPLLYINDTDILGGIGYDELKKTVEAQVQN